MRVTKNLIATLEAAISTKTAYWDALANLEKAIGFPVENEWIDSIDSADADTLSWLEQKHEKWIERLKKKNLTGKK